MVTSNRIAQSQSPVGRAQQGEDHNQCEENGNEHGIDPSCADHVDEAQDVHGQEQECYSSVSEIPSAMAGSVNVSVGSYSPYVFINSGLINPSIVLVPDDE